MRLMWAWIGLVSAIVLLSGALLVWQDAPDWVADWQSARPDVMLWAVRSGVIAVIAAAQVLVLTMVIGRLYPRRSLDDGLRLACSVAAVLACVSAAALGLAAR